MASDREQAPPKVLDLSMDLSGQYATRLLCRHGFEVTRACLVHPRAAPSILGTEGTERSGSLLDRYLNRGKQTMTIDLTTVEGQGDLNRLIQAHDFVVTTFLAPDAHALGLDLTGIRSSSPASGLVTITPYGSCGARSQLPATEKTLLAHAGAMLVSGAPSGVPYCPNLPIASILGGIYGAMAVLLETSGEAGRHDGGGIDVDIALMDVVAANLERVLAWYTHLEAVPLRGVGSGRPEQSAGGGSLRAADGYFYVFSGYQWFDRVAEMVGRPDLQRTNHIDDPEERRAETARINEAVAAAIAGLPVNELADRAQSLRMPSGPVNTVATLPSDPQMVWRRTFSEAEDGSLEIDEPFRIRSVPPQRPVVARSPRGDAPSTSPLAGIKVVDLTHAFAGPTSGRVLAEAGADVIKVESVGRLDLLARGMLPFDNRTSGAWWDRSGYFAERNLGKRAITLDMATVSGRGIFIDLLADADVVLSNFTPRVLRDWGLEPESMLTANPMLVVLLMSGFGQDGPKSENPALAGTMEAASGFSSLVRPDDSSPPGALGFNFGDMVSGLYGAAAVLFALDRRKREGAGQVIDLACAEAPLAFLASQILSCWDEGVEPSVCADPFHAGTHVLIQALGEPGKEAWVLTYIAPDDEGLFEKLSRSGDLGCAQEGEGGNRPGALRSHLKRQDLLDLLAVNGLCAAPLSDAEDLWYDPVLRERSLFLFASRLSVGVLPYARQLPLRCDGGPLEAFRHSIPTLGEQNWEVLVDELGISPEAIAELEQQGITGTVPSGHLPKTFQVPLALDDLENLGLIRRVDGARKRLISSFATEDVAFANGGSDSAG